MKPTSQSTEHAPVFFDPSKPSQRAQLQRIARSKQCLRVVDTLADQLHELAEVRKSALIFKKERSMPRVTSRDGLWVWYPWKGTLVRILQKSQFRQLRLSRNQNLITKAEQQQLQKKTIAIAGLNVGNPGAVACALMGIGSRFVLADPDTLSLSNLNRFRAGLCELGANKAILSAQQMLEIDPFLDIRTLPAGVPDGGAAAFLQRPTIDLLIEETDHLQLKIQLRQEAKKRQIPVIMVTGNGSNLILDVERYDSARSPKILNGYLRPTVQRAIEHGSARTPQQHIRLARDFMGSRWLTRELRQSFQDIGKTLAGIPQLGGTTMLRGAVLSYAAKQILLNKRLPSGRYIVSLDRIAPL